MGGKQKGGGGFKGRGHSCHAPDVGSTGLDQFEQLSSDLLCQVPSNVRVQPQNQLQTLQQGFC